MRPHGALPVAILLLTLCQPALAQERNAIDVLRGMSLDSLGGIVTVYYSDGYVDRARRLQQRYAGAVEFYRDTLAEEFQGGLAVLDPEDWGAFTNSRPYGQPHMAFSSWSRHVAVLPATSSEGVMADLVRRLGLGRDDEVTAYVDVIGFHEFGHALVGKYFYRDLETGR